MAGFWENFDDTSGLNWVKEEEKKLLVSEGVVLPVLAVKVTNTQYGERYILVTEIEGETRALGFSKGGEHPVESRDNMFAAMQAYLEQEDAETPYVKVVKKGRSYLVVNPDTEIDTD